MQGRNGGDRGGHWNHPLPQSKDYPSVVTLFARIAVAVVAVVVFVAGVVALADIVSVTEECDESGTSKAPLELPK